MKPGEYRSKQGVRVKIDAVPLNLGDALLPVYESINNKKGAIFSSGFDYPGRHSRWDIGFRDPALEFVSREKRFSIRALSEQGVALLEIIQPDLSQHPHVAQLERLCPTQGRSLFGVRAELSGRIRSSDKFFTEEERSRQPSIFSVLRFLLSLFEPESHELEKASHFGLYGAFGYDLVLQFESLQLKHRRNDEEKDCHLFLPLEVYVVDRKKELAWKIQHNVATPHGWTNEFSGVSEPVPQRTEIVAITDSECDHQSGEFAEKVKAVIQGAKRGDYFEVVLSQSFSQQYTGKPTDLFQRIAQVNPSPYMFLLNFGDEQLLGASPEIYVRVTGRRYETCPIAGTVRRGESALEDADRVRELMGSKKDESELTMCTDVDRNDMARVCIPGSVRVLGRRQLEFYSHLIHTVDHLEGELKPTCDALDAFQTHMWACTVTGAPKPAAMQEIENLEKSPRGWYSGAIGAVSFSGNINTGITLRSAQLKNGVANFRAGATLLYGSNPEEEELETRTKAAAFRAALAETERAAKPLHHTVSFEPIQKKVLLVDYRDSFVHNLAAYFQELGCSVTTIRYDFPEDALTEAAPDLVLLSPGPGTPEEFGVPEMVGKLSAKKLPIFGVCLGHQGIGQYFGATLGVLPVPFHGKVSPVHHSGHPLFTQVECPFEVGRYHSLYLVPETVPKSLEVIASTEPTEENPIRIPMAVIHRELPIAGVQFHPESLMTLKGRTGHQILRNALTLLVSK